MKRFVNVIAFICLLSVIYSSCAQSGHKQQSWKPKTGKKMKAGRNTVK
jgi:outer membrane lipoprotein-sorting protein